MDTKKTKRTVPAQRDPHAQARTVKTRSTSRTSKSASGAKQTASAVSTKQTSGSRPARKNTATRREEGSRRPAATQAPSKTRRASGTPKGRKTVKVAPEVVYTPAKPFSRGRLLVRLTTVVAVVLALSFGISIFFKVENITVSGADKYDVWTVKEASGIEIGENLLSFGKAKAAGKIKTALPYVQSVRIGIKLPDTVNIEIKELDVVYAIKDAVEQWWLITSDGRVVDKADRAVAGDYTQVVGVKLATPVAGQQAVAQQLQLSATESTDYGDMPTMMPVVTAADQLQVALNILQYLEDCSIIGEVAMVDVNDLGNIELQYGQRFQVKLGDTTQLLYKIKCMNAAINGKDEVNSLKEYDSGILDITFTIKENQIIYQASEE